MSFERPSLTIENLHREHGERIRRYLVRLVGAVDAEDVEQDVFERAQRAIGTFRGDSSALTWLYRVATNAAIDRLRSAGRRAEIERVDDAERSLETGASVDPASDRSLDRELDRTRMRECVLRVVEQLPASQRAVILLGELHGRADREVADALAISVGAAKIRLHRARGALKAELERACTFERDEQNEFACAPRPRASSLCGNAGERPVSFPVLRSSMRRHDPFAPESLEGRRTKWNAARRISASRSQE